jgi:hypothetical protein
MSRLRTIFSLALIAAGGLSGARRLAQRRPERVFDRKVGIVVDYDDVQAVSIRGALPLNVLLRRLKGSGATGVTLPETTLGRLLRSGEIFQSIPRVPLREPPPFGRWLYFATADSRLAESLVAELAARLPRLNPQILPEDPHTFALAGDLAAIDRIGLGFDEHAARLIHENGLTVVPRPQSYDWHERVLIDRTIAQAASVGDQVVAFDGDLILGHEMHLDETLAALEAHNLTFAYFAQSRHQRGDWFIAKRRVPYVVIAHQFTPEQMIPEDFHSISHHWAKLARERGVRLFFVNFFRVVHATEPLEGLHYLEHIRSALEGEGFQVEAPRSDGRRTEDDGGAETEDGKSFEALLPAGAGAIAAGAILGLPDAATMALAGAGAAGAMLGIKRLDRARDALEQRYAPAYASKVVALSIAALGPLAAAAIAQTSDSETETLLADGIIGVASAVSLAALTSTDEYRLRIEEYKGFDLDLWLPIAGTLLLQRAPLSRKLAGMLLAGGGWYVTRRFVPDPLARLDAAPAMSHTHHLSAAMRAVGDAILAVGPRPVRKWAGLAPFGLVLSISARKRGYPALALGALIVSAIGHAAGNTGFRRPERDPELTAQLTGKSWLAGAGTGLIIAKIVQWIL